MKLQKPKKNNFHFALLNIYLDSNLCHNFTNVLFTVLILNLTNAKTFKLRNKTPC